MNGITSWTSNGMDWSAKDALILGSLYDRCEAIRLAVRERQLAIGQTPSGIFIESFEIHLYPLSAFFSAVQSAITSLIPQYVNHTDHDGDWNGVAQDALAPAWTEATLLAAIGASARLVPNILGTCADWIYQQYQILNMMRWINDGVKTSPGMTGKHTNVYETGYKAGSGSTWSETVSNFNSAQWNISNSSSGGIYNTASKNLISRSFSSFNLNTYTSFSVKIDWYAYFWNMGTSVYKNNDYDAASSVWIGIESNTSVSTNITLGRFDDNSMPDPGENTLQWTVTDSLGYRTVAILKPSFAFNNWLTE